MARHHSVTKAAEATDASRHCAADIAQTSDCDWAVLAGRRGGEDATVHTLAAAEAAEASADVSMDLGSSLTTPLLSPARSAGNPDAAPSSAGAPATDALPSSPARPAPPLLQLSGSSDDEAAAVVRRPLQSPPPHAAAEGNLSQQDGNGAGEGFAPVSPQQLLFDAEDSQQQALDAQQVHCPSGTCRVCVTEGGGGGGRPGRLTSCMGELWD